MEKSARPRPSKTVNPEIAETLREIPPYAVARKVLKIEPGAFSACKRAGIFEIYTQVYVDELAAFITARFCKQAEIVEACAGDGRLTKALQQRGIAVTPVDDRSRGTEAWESAHRPPRPPSGSLADRHPVRKPRGPDIAYPDWVIKGNAVEYVTQHQPDVVIASWVECGDALDQRLVETGIPVIIIAETNLGGTTGTEEFWERDDFAYEHLKTISAYNLSRADAIRDVSSLGPSTSTHLVTMKL